MTLPLWSVILLTSLATLGIYKTVQVWRRDMELLGRVAEMERLRQEVEEYEKENEMVWRRVDERENVIHELMRERGLKNMKVRGMNMRDFIDLKEFVLYDRKSIKFRFVENEGGDLDFYVNDSTNIVGTRTKEQVELGVKTQQLLPMIETNKTLSEMMNRK